MPENKSLDRWIVEGEVKKRVPEIGNVIGSRLSVIGKKRARVRSRWWFACGDEMSDCLTPPLRPKGGA